MAFTALLMIAIPKPLIAIYVDPWDPKNAVLVGFALHIVLAAASSCSAACRRSPRRAARIADTRIPMWSFCIGCPASAPLALALHPAEAWGGHRSDRAAALLGWRWHRREALGLTRRGLYKFRPRCTISRGNGIEMPTSSKALTASVMSSRPR